MCDLAREVYLGHPGGITLVTISSLLLLFIHSDSVVTELTLTIYNIDRVN